VSQAGFYRSVAAVQRALLPVQSASEAAAAAHRLADAAIGQTPEAEQRDCAPGCSFCCHFPVGVTWAEAELLVTAIAAQPALADAVVAAAKDTRTHSWQQLASSLLPCPLLQDGRCAVYAVRPLGCRGWNSADAAACERAFGPGTQTSVPIDMAAHIAALGASAALLDWCARKGLPEGSRELRSALAAMLDALPGELAAAFARARPVA
jgi:hypothetical protein